MSERSQRKKIIEYNLEHDTDYPNISPDKFYPDIDPDGHFQLMTYMAKYTDIKDFSMKEYDDGLLLTIKDYSGDEYEFFNVDKELCRRIFLTIAKGIIKFKTEDWSYYE